MLRLGDLDYSGKTKEFLDLLEKMIDSLEELIKNKTI